MRLHLKSITVDIPKTLSFLCRNLTVGAEKDKETSAAWAAYIYTLHSGIPSKVIAINGSSHFLFIPTHSHSALIFVTETHFEMHLR